MGSARLHYRAMAESAGILLTAFEPSGDTLGARFVEVLRQHHPDLPVWALGGPKMQAAGATIIERTTDHAVMGTGAISHARLHHQRVARLKHWIADKLLIGHLPVDSPAANWAICKLVRQTQPKTRIVHLAAPQLWAWAPWRIKKMRRLSDHVLCLLPFEPAWFNSRNMPATFVGHPMFDSVLPTDIGNLPDTDAPRLAFLPGSRRSEMQRNWPTMVAVWRGLREQGINVVAGVAAFDDAAEHVLRSHACMAPFDHAWPAGMTVLTGRADTVLHWADTVLVVSGTATLQVARHRKPMVVIYNASRLTWNTLGRFLIETRTFALPNIISESMDLGRAVPEFVPHFGDVPPILDSCAALLTDEGAKQRVTAVLERVCEPYQSITFGQKAYESAAGLFGLK